MRISRISIVATAAATMIASGAGFAVASTGAAQRSASSGTEHFYLMSTRANASRYVVIATGKFTAGGVDVAGATADTVRLAAGTFKVSHSSAGTIIKDQSNPKTCWADFVVTTKITLGHGTRAYKGISGSGKATISAIQIARKIKGACSATATPLFSEETITATVHVHL
jgi:hypothetical protein